MATPIYIWVVFGIICTRSYIYLPIWSSKYVRVPLQHGPLLLVEYYVKGHNNRDYIMGTSQCRISYNCHDEWNTSSRVIGFILILVHGTDIGTDHISHFTYTHHNPTSCQWRRRRSPGYLSGALGTQESGHSHMPTWSNHITIPMHNVTSKHNNFVWWWNNTDHAWVMSDHALLTCLSLTNSLHVNDAHWHGYNYNIYSLNLNNNTIALTGELWCVYRDYCSEEKTCCNGPAMLIGKTEKNR